MTDINVSVGDSQPINVTIDGVGSNDHSLLSNLLWSTAGHTIDENFDINSNKIINVSDPTANKDAANKEYVDSNIQGLEWQESVISFLDLTTAEPVSPTIGDRYINTVTGTSNVTAQSVTINNIYEWNGTSFTETVVSEGFAAWIDDEDIVYVFNGTNWIKFGSTVTHNNLSGLQGGTANEFFHLTSAQHSAITGFTQGSVLFQGASVISEDNTNFFWDDTNNRLGIGTSSPDGTLNVQKGSAGAVTADTGANTFVVEGSDTFTGMSLLSPDASFNNIWFGSPGEARGSLVRWQNSANLMTIGTNVANSDIRFVTGAFSEAMRILVVKLDLFVQLVNGRHSFCRWI